MKRYVAVGLLSVVMGVPLHARMLAAGSETAVRADHVLNAAVPAIPDVDACCVLAESNDDPGYKLYKEGYNLVLEESWRSARKKFSELLDKYPKSEYADDARYWSAFALKHIDKKEAKADYRKFIEDYPKSSYYDEALNDYLELSGGSAKGLNSLTVGSGGQVYVDEHGVLVKKGNVRLGEDGVVVGAPEGDTPPIAVHGSSGAGKGHTYTYTFAPTARMTNQKMRLAERQVARQLARLTPLRTPSPPSAVSPFRGMEEEYDKETRLRMDALYAIGETKEDSISFRTLRDVAVDTGQPLVLRETAMDALANFSRYDVLPVFLEIAKKDTSEEIQNLAIDYMGQLSRNKNKSLESLTELFEVIPKERSTQRQTVLASIAEIGNDKAVDFLANVARTNEDYDLRSDAVYYLGNIGGDKARIALYEILKGK